MALTIESNGVQLKGNTLGFVYDDSNRVIEIQGKLKAFNDNTWQMNMVIDEIDFETNSGNCNTTLTSPNGATVISDVKCKSANYKDWFDRNFSEITPIQ
jgi:hypothetical protein